MIMLLGILAAVALPRFLDLDEEAHLASANTVLGAFTSSTAMMQGQWLAEGADDTTLTIDNATVTFSTQGLPQSPTANTAGCIDLWQTVLKTDLEIAPFVFGAPNPEWSEWRIGNWCLYLYETGDAYNPAQTPLFLYFQIALPPTYMAGDVLRLNFE